MRTLHRRIRARAAMLRDATRHEPGGVSYFSMTRAERWLYFHSLEPLLRLWPWPIWRTPATLIATVRLFTEDYTDPLAREMLFALGRPAHRWARLRYRWRLWYSHEIDRLLLLQPHKLTPTWAWRHTTISGTLPTGGALLIMPHHSCRRLGLMALANMAGPFGIITSRPIDPATFDRLDVTLRHIFTRGQIFTRQMYGDRRFSTQGFAARRSLRLLQGGGYLINTLDSNAIVEPTQPLFGRQLTFFTAGTIWLAQRSTRPIVPVMVESTWHGWRLRIGEPIRPETEAIRSAIEDCLRFAPESWELTVAMMWRHAPEGAETT